MMIYYCPLTPGAFKTYSTPDASFWCCVGTGLESHAKYSDTIYFHDDSSLYVNLFVASELKWDAKGVTVRQDTRFPAEDTTRLTVTASSPVRLAMRVRYPAWAQSGMELSVNGQAQPVTAKPGTFVVVEREWKAGDTLQVRLPMSLRLEAMPDDPTVVAVLYGPILLAGDLGKARHAAERFASLFGRQSFLLELQRHHERGDRKLNVGLSKLADSLGLRLIATGAVHYLSPDDAPLHES